MNTSINQLISNILASDNGISDYIQLSIQDLWVISSWVSKKENELFYNKIHSLIETYDDGISDYVNVPIWDIWELEKLTN